MVTEKDSIIVNGNEIGDDGLVTLEMGVRCLPVAMPRQPAQERIEIYAREKKGAAQARPGSRGWLGRQKLNFTAN